jgi:hypothetical protein
VLTSFHLSVAAIACAALSLGSCFLDWAVPAQSLADLMADTIGKHAEGAPLDPRRQAQIREAYPLQGTDEPFHGVLLMVLAAAGALLVVGGVSMARDGERADLAEGLLRGAGAVLGIAFLLTLLDGGSDVFIVRSRGAGIYAAIVLSLAGCLAATFASATLSRRKQPESSESESSEDGSANDPV